MTTYYYPAVNGSLPANAATETKQDDIITELQGIAALDFATEAKQDDIVSELQGIAALDFATEAKQDDIISELQGIAALDFATEAKQDDVITELQAIKANSNLGVIDQIDTTPLLDCSSTNIPASSGNPVQVVASLAAAAKKIISVEDIGEYIGLYTGEALSEVLYCVLPLGGGEIEVSIPAATRISLRAMKNTAITSSNIALNFLG